MSPTRRRHVGLRLSSNRSLWGSPRPGESPFLAGRSEARLAYLDLLQKACGTCLDLQREHYRRETRWPDAPFWRRRQELSYGMEPLARRGVG